MNTAAKWHFDTCDDGEPLGCSVFDTSEVERWQQYERAKQQLMRAPLTPAQYEARLALLVDELGL